MANPSPDVSGSQPPLSYPQYVSNRRRAPSQPLIRLPETFPDFPPVEIAWRWAGVMDQTPDGRPLVGRWPETSDLWVAAGFGGHGLPPALRVGKAIAAAIACGETSTELRHFDPARFGQTGSEFS